MPRKRTVISGIIILLLLAIMIFSITQMLNTKYPSGEEDGESKTIIRNGIKYFPKQDIDVILFMGIDKNGPVQDSGSYNNDGEADMVSLLLFNESDKTYSVLVLNRDTILQMPTLGIGGKYAGKTTAQLALSHTYGSGLADSCENTKKTVSDFLYGLEIDYYVSLNMDAVEIINDAVGGVEVNVIDDFPQETGIQKGKFRLEGKQALEFVRARKDVGDQFNTSRMERHKEYMKGFMDALDAKLDSGESFILDTYNEVSGYMVTDCSIDIFYTLASQYSDYQFKEIISPEGENLVSTKYMEFHIDEKKLDDLIIRLFYDEKEF